MQTMELRAVDKYSRCDRCNAQGFVVAEKGPMALVFCNHHGRQYKQSLEVQGWVLLDQPDEVW
jgi:hypothetical protein